MAQGTEWYRETRWHRGQTFLSSTPTLPLLPEYLQVITEFLFSLLESSFSPLLGIIVGMRILSNNMCKMPSGLLAM